MRSDMHRVIITRPRKLESAARKGRAKPLEELPSKKGMRRGVKERDGDKSFKDLLSPLRRYLAKQVGRPWNKVYSEMKAGRRLDSVAQRHLLLHVEDFVAVEPRRRIIRFGIAPNTWRQEHLWFQPFYVDERDGILKRTDRLPEEKTRRRKLKEEKARKGSGRKHPCGRISHVR
jgi:hypothetical protein